ncbi:hypothetical protein Mycch_3290 [Mycolicibacterium chubuense NBB4]|uniref:SHOCT domain-containing protein n=1 Tax=Mycolicibacterium chubuense (strain NBB4) TaxID=710421 RepID=I4BL78_MYCCN|nr:SHOCT domain-containing protein [Mycolicibacterium chubuense]AFM18035.1 hypothetical protein Mycch_3290 [Mycolicibacterium chubuense NBB4]
MTGRAGPRVAIVCAVVTLVAGVAGLVVSLVLSAFFFDEFDAYGGFPVPPLRIGITAPPGVPGPVVTEAVGSTTSVNNDVRVRVWVAQIARDGVYDIRTGGDVGGYIHPALAFGRDRSPGWPLWVSVAAIAVGAGALAFALIWRSRSGKAATPLPDAVPLDEPIRPGPLPADPYQPSDRGVRLEQLKTLAALRDSGALTEAEFQAEKRRVLDS